MLVEKRRIIIIIIIIILTCDTTITIFQNKLKRKSRFPRKSSRKHAYIILTPLNPTFIL